MKYRQFTFDAVAPTGQTYSINCTAANETVAHYVVCGEYPNWHIADKAKEENTAHYYLGEIDASGEEAPYYPRIGQCPDY